MEDAAAALNTRLTALGATFQLPLLADRTPYGCAMLVSDILIILPTLASPGDTSVLLQSLALTLSWCSEPLNEETALAVLEATEGLAVHGDPETSHAACVALNALLKHCLPKKKQGVQAKVITMLPGNDGTVDGTLAEVYLNAVSVQTKTQAALAVTHLVELGSHLMQQAAPTSSRAFMSYSERLGSILHHLHHSCITALRHKDLQPSNAQHVASLLHLLQSAVALTPYYKLPATAALLSEFIPDLLVMAAGNEKGSVIAAMQVLCSAVGSKRPFQQMASALEAAPEALDQVCELARTRHFVAFKHEAVRLWSAVARNYSWIVLPRLEVLLQLIRDLQEAPDQMSKLTALLFISAASDQSLPSVMQPSEEIPVIDFACFGTSNLPPGADATEVTTTGDMLRKPSTVQEGASTHACVFADKQPLFLEVVHSLVLPLVSDPVAAVRGHAVLALGNIPPATLDSLPSEQSRLLFDTVLETCRDDNNTVRGAVAKVVGVWVGAACILERRGCVVNALLEMFRAEQQALHQKAAWALSCLCERLRGAGDVDDQEALSSIVRGCMEVLDRLPNKVPWNVVRALGNSGLLYAGPLDSVLRALSRLFDDSNVKVRWNTAYAIAQIFRNPHLRVVYQEASQSRSPSPQGALALVTKLATVLQNEQNFKVRIQACWALAALQAFPIQGKTLPLVLGAVLKALHSCDSHIDHEQYKYRDVLTVSLKGLILHVLRFCMKVAKGATGSTLSSEDKHEGISIWLNFFSTVEIAQTVATQPRQLHYSNFRLLFKKKSKEKSPKKRAFCSLGAGAERIFFTFLSLFFPSVFDTLCLKF